MEFRGSEEARRVSACRWRTRLLAGLETGTLAGLVMLLWFALEALRRGMVWYAIPNLLGSAFYGPAALRAGLGRVTLAGISLELAHAGLAGAVFGLIAAKITGFGRALMFGLTAGLVDYAVLYFVVWRHTAPLLARHSPEPATLLAHLLYGVVLSRLPARCSRLEAAIGTPAPVPKAGCQNDP